MKITTTTKVLFAIAIVMVFSRSLMKLNFIDYSRYILVLGTIIGVIACVLYISNSKKTIKTLEEEKEQLEKELKEKY